MRWNKFTLKTRSEVEDIVISTLAEAGVEGVEIEDKVPLTEQDKQQMFVDILPDGPADDGIAYLNFFVEEQEDGSLLVNEESTTREAVLASVEEELAGLRQFCDIGEGSITVDETEDIDWINNWKQYFKPFRVGETFLIKPSWEQCEPEEGRRILEIDPSSSFGTGTHNTTQLCICELERLVKSGDRLLDMGCGSGILSVAAHMLGAEDVTAVDIDPNAVRIAAENAEKNGFALHTGVGDVIGDAELSVRIGGDYDIIVANIVADVIMGMQDILKSKLKREGTLIVSGIIAPRADEVQASLLGAGFVLDRRDQSGDWVAMTLHQA